MPAAKRSGCSPWSRLRRVQQADKAVECHLGHYSLDKVLPEYEGYHRPTSEPLTSHRYVWGDYAALSYVWGERREESRIYINGIEVKIRSNLAAALEVIRDSPEVAAGLKLWVDAICINQLDNEEKGRQIRRMGSIYAYARLVFFWLGQGTEDSDLAFRGANRKNEADTTVLYRGGLKAICRICLNAYWYRLWTFQEIALGADSSIILCGTNRCTWSTFASAISSLLAVQGYMGIPNQDLRMLEEIGNLYSVSMGRSWTSHILVAAYRGTMEDKRELAAGRSKLLYPPLPASLAIGQTRRALCSDPRDKVYGMLALLEPSLQELIVPRYDQSVFLVYWEFAKAVIQEE
jgi:hypothetical protein